MTTSAVLSPLDSAFLRVESGSSPMHIASLAVFEGPAPTLGEVHALIASRLDQLPRYRQQVRESPLWLGRPMWVDEPGFALRDHVYACGVPAPGGEAELRGLCSRLLERHLDRERALWESWLVTGLQDGRWALLSKVHHCMVDGIAGTDLLARMLDLSPDAVAPQPPAPWQPERAPGLARRVLAGLPSPRSATRGVQAVRHPLAAARSAVTDVQGLSRWLSASRQVAPSPLVGPVGKQRDWLWADVSFEEVHELGSALGGTVNDVAETLICAALRRLLLSDGERPDAESVRSLVPVSVRRYGPGSTAALEANQVSAVLARLPVDVEDPLERFAAVREELRRLKRSGQAQAGELITAAAGLVPPLLLTSTLAGGFRLPHRNLTIVTTNVPGPPVPLYAQGRRLLELHPFVPIADRLRLGFALTSYGGRLWFGVTVDRAHVRNADVLVAALPDALEELRRAAGARV